MRHDAYPEVRGRCPACGASTLFLGAGGYVTCARTGCPDPGAASDLLEHPRFPVLDLDPDTPTLAMIRDAIVAVRERYAAVPDDLTLRIGETVWGQIVDEVWSAFDDRERSKAAFPAIGRVRLWGVQVVADERLVGWTLLGHPPRRIVDSGLAHANGGNP